MTDYTQIQQTHPCREVISRYVTIKKKARDKFAGPCPIHEDKGTHLTVYTVDGVEWWYCTVCHEGGDVVDFVAAIEHCTKPLAAERITDDLLPAVGTFTPQPVAASEAKAWRPIMPVPLDAPPYKPELTYIPESGRLKNWSRMERMDAYHDADGQLLCWAIRILRPGGMAMTPTVTYCGGPDGARKWCAKRMDPPLPLMGLADLERYKGRWVLLVPHEQAKMEHDQFCVPSPSGGPALLSVTWLGGPKAVGKVDWSPLYGRHIDYAPLDNENGRRAMKEAHRIIVENRIEKSGTGIGR